MSRWAYIATCMVLMTIFMVAFGAFVAKPVGYGFASWLDGTVGPVWSSVIIFGTIASIGIWAYRNN